MDEGLVWPEEVRVELGLLADILASLRRIEKLLEEDNGWEAEEEA